MTSSLPNLPSRRANANKGDCGHVLVAAGSVGMTGAAALTAEAALRSGAGLVTLLCPDGAWAALASALREVMVRPVGPEGARGWTARAAAEALDFIERSASRRMVCALGPGMTREPDAARAAVDLALGLALPLVLDADGLNAFEGCAGDLARRTAPTVLTPHPGEAARLVGGFDGRDDGRDHKARRDAAAELARTTKAVVILKGHRSVVTDGERVEINATGNPGMATAGAGDVLTGVVAGLLAQGMTAFDAAVLGAHVHGLAGDLAAANVGELSLVAGDVLRSLPAAFVSMLAGHGG